MDKFEFDKIRERNGDSTQDIAAFLGISVTSVYNKKNESGTQFTKKEIEMLSERWHLTPVELKNIFFVS